MTVKPAFRDTMMRRHLSSGDTIMRTHINHIDKYMYSTKYINVPLIWGHLSFKYTFLRRRRGRVAIHNVGGYVLQMIQKHGPSWSR